MLENRSFDHMLGFSGLPGTAIPEGLTDSGFRPVPEGVDSGFPGVDPDPDHDFASVMLQMYGQTKYDPQARPTMNHFVRSYQSACGIAGCGKNIMNCQPPGAVPVLTKLASEYALCTSWFSSIPGPTLPNRLFVHLGTSMGRLDMSAIDVDAPKSVYEVLGEGNVSSTIYASGWSTAATFPALNEYPERYFGTLDDFYQDCADNDLPGYCFLEPQYGSDLVDGVFRPQNDQHPDSDLLAGDELILSIYNAICARQEVWESSVFIITYDEHGGIYDHCVPPPAVAPDCESSQDPPFDFKRYGVRVPAVIVSPYTPRGMLVTDVCDHTSVIACARKLLTGVWQDCKLGLRAQQAYPLDAAFQFDKSPRPAEKLYVPLVARARSLPRPKKKNGLQSEYVEMAKRLEEKLSPNRQTGIVTGKIKTDMDAQHYIRHVYAEVARFKTPEGGRCGCA
jgi:phospholipase C